MCDNPNLIWNDEHKYVKVKIINSMKKVTSTKLVMHQVYLCFNEDALSNIFLEVG